MLKYQYCNEASWRKQFVITTKHFTAPSHAFKKRIGGTDTSTYIEAPVQYWQGYLFVNDKYHIIVDCRDCFTAIIHGEPCALVILVQGGSCAL